MTRKEAKFTMRNESGFFVMRVPTDDASECFERLAEGSRFWLAVESGISRPTRVVGFDPDGCPLVSDGEGGVLRAFDHPSAVWAGKVGEAVQS